MLWLAIAIAIVIATAGSGLRLLQQQSALREVGVDIAAAAARYAEAQRMLRQRRQLGRAQRFTEETVDGTTRTVQRIHRGIADFPFEVLDCLPETRDTARIVREIHDLTSDTVYDSIRGINRLLGSGLRRGLLADDTQRPKKSRLDDE